MRGKVSIQYAGVDEIVISPKRQRRAFDEGKHVELCDSIQNKATGGLLHAIVLRIDGGKKILVAGERRLRAFKDSHELGVDCFHAGERVPAGMIPYTDLGEMDPLDAWEAELEENIRRVDLSWQERANAAQELMEMRKAKAEQRGLPAPTVASIAEELTGRSDGGYQSDTRQELIVAKHLDDPEVAAAPTVRQAYKVLKRKEARQANAVMAESLGKAFSSNVHTLVNQDSEEWIKTLADNTFNVIVTDPPYGMDADTFGDSGGMAAGAHSYSDDEAGFLRIVEWMPEQLYRVAAPQAHAYIFCDIDWFGLLKDRMTEAGWKVFRTPLIWHKPNGFRAPWPDAGPQRRYELILYANKGGKKTQRLAGDVISILPDENLGHSAQKPVALYKDLLLRSAVAGDKVLDAFCGTGPIFPAAQALNIYATGCEKDPASYAISAKRIKDLT